MKGGELVPVRLREARRFVAAEPRTLEITRVCTLGDRNANSRLYGAICRAAAALGYRSAITYTLQSENGASLRAVGFREDASSDGGTWNRPGRPRREINLFGEEESPTEPKTRWRRDL